MAYACYEASLYIRWELTIQFPDNPEYLYQYSVTLCKVARIHEALKSNSVALEYYKDALKIRRMLINKYPQSSDYLYGYSTSLEKVARIYQIEKNVKAALPLYMQAHHNHKTVNRTVSRQSWISS